MNRVMACGLALCLCMTTQDLFAQGLLGKPNVSAQYLLFRAGDDFDGVETDTGNGGRIQFSVPLLGSDDEAAWAAGMDVFGAFSGFSVGLGDPFSPGTDLRFLGGDVGATFYSKATENIRPFAQLGLNHKQMELKRPGDPTLDETETKLILTAGLEIDVLPWTALRASYGRGNDSFGHTAFLGEVIVRPSDHWFGRFGASVGNDKTVITGIGLGFAW